MMIGAFTQDGAATFPGGGDSALVAYEQMIGRKLAQVLWFLTFDDRSRPSPARRSWPTDRCRS